jgi:hypothetical protein
MSRAIKITLAILLLAVAAGTIYFRGLHRQILRLAHLERSEDQARREVIRPVIAAPEDKKVKVKIFWASREDPLKLEPVEVDLPAAAEPAERARLALDVLIASPPDPVQRTLPADTVLLALYVLPDGTAIADFSDALSGETPSGIASEQLAVDSISRTLHASLPAAQRLRILIQGQEVETLAGHVDLTGAFDLADQPAPAAEPQAAPGKPTQKAGTAPALTPAAAPVTLKP